MFVSLLYLSILPLLYLVLYLPWQKFAPDAKATFHICLKSAQLLKGAPLGTPLHPFPWHTPLYTESGNWSGFELIWISSPIWVTVQLLQVLVPAQGWGQLKDKREWREEGWTGLLRSVAVLVRASSKWACRCSLSCSMHEYWGSLSLQFLKKYLLEELSSIFKQPLYLTKSSVSFKSLFLKRENDGPSFSKAHCEQWIALDTNKCSNWPMLMISEHLSVPFVSPFCGIHAEAFFFCPAGIFGN